MKSISVIIPSYNRGQCIIKAVESVLAQTYPVQEIIIVDDCSQDNTEEVLQQIEDPRIRYFRLPQNRGAGGARNFGVDQAKYDLIAFHDSDDEWAVNKIERQMEYWGRYPDYGLMYTAYSIIMPDQINYVGPDMSGDRKLEGNILTELLYKNTVDTPAIVVKKQIFYEVGGFDETMRALEDWDFAIKVAKKYPIGFVPEVLLQKGYSEGSISSNKGAYYQNRCYMLRKHMTEYLENDIFDKTVQFILEQAKEDNILPQVEKMMMMYLSN